MDGCLSERVSEPRPIQQARISLPFLTESIYVIPCASVCVCVSALVLAF